MYMIKPYSHLSNCIAHISGQPSTSILAIISVLTWLIIGPFVSFSDTWLLVFTAVTSIITFLMVFIIQSTQNRQDIAIQIKLNEIILALKKTDNIHLDIEGRTQDELNTIKKKYVKLAKKARHTKKPAKT